MKHVAISAAAFSCAGGKYAAPAARPACACHALCEHRTGRAVAKKAARCSKSKADRTSLSGPLGCARPPVTAAILPVIAEKNQQRSRRRVARDRLECV